MRAGNVLSAHRALIFTVVAMLALSAAFAIALLVDPRVLPNGEGVWLKPLRFSLAFAIHAATLYWISLLTARREAQDAWFAWSAWLQVGVIFVELACVGLQAGRGVASHFNYATPLDRAVFTIMGIGTAGLFLGFVLIVAGLARKPASGTAGSAVMAAMAFALLGGLAGVAMVMPTPMQAIVLDQGIRPDVIGSHLVGVASELKMPFFAWDLAAGDWRVPHFLGLHALQAIPLLAWLAPGTAGAPARYATWLGCLGYGLIFGWSVLKTLEGSSLFQPDSANHVVIGVGVAIYLSGIALAARTRRMLRHP